ncbi:nuclear transport factor 2 family protein [Aliikangiella coralliicola]|nr:nuclear transport factor 2 family protein [Aliikangiella coralliicola]
MSKSKFSDKSFNAWLTRYGRAWIEQNPDAAASLFTADCPYYDTPFNQPLSGKEAIHQYWTKGAKESQKDIEFSFEAARISGVTGYARWTAKFTRIENGQRVEIEGFLEAQFNEDVICTCFREWWHSRTI